MGQEALFLCPLGNLVIPTHLSSEQWRYVGDTYIFSIKGYRLYKNELENDAQYKNHFVQLIDN